MLKVKQRISLVHRDVDKSFALIGRRAEILAWIGRWGKTKCLLEGDDKLDFKIIIRLSRVHFY